MEMSKEKIFELLKKIQDPELKRDIVSLGMVKEVSVHGENVFVHLEVTTPDLELRKQLKSLAQQEIQKHLNVNNIHVEVSGNVRQAAAAGAGETSKPKMPLPGIKQIVAVASGKGGVGKTTVAVHLALALAKKGFRVGLMDGDVYGPNVPLMLGIPAEKRPAVNENEKIIPLNAYGVEMISMGVLVPPDQPMVWRGPMLHGAITQFLQKVEWGELDYLIVDLPPGTGDVQLSLAQTVPLAGAVMVTTPQEVALMDVRKGIAMFQKTSVPLLGIIENMAGDIFGEGGGEKAAERYQVPFLGRIYLDARIREGGDQGRPVVISDSESESAKRFLQFAETLHETLGQTVSS